MLVQAENKRVMKKFIILLLLMVCGVAVYGINVALPTYKYVKYGNGLELIVKFGGKSWQHASELRSYGVRKNGNVLLTPDYSVNEVSFPADLYLLVFMKHTEKTVHVYDIESGEEILFYHYQDSISSNDGKFCGFEFTGTTVDGKKQYQLAAKIDHDGQTSLKIIAVFYRQYGKTLFLKP